MWLFVIGYSVLILFLLMNLRVCYTQGEHDLLTAVTDSEKHAGLFSLQVNIGHLQ